MNPAQVPGTNPGGTPTPPNPQDGPVVDMPENGFGFSDEQPQLPQVRPVAQQPMADRRLTSPAVYTPAQPAPAPQPVAAPVAPALAPQPMYQPMPAPAPNVAQPLPVQPSAQTMQPVQQMPQNMMPPAAIPAVPTLTAPQPAPAPALTPLAPPPRAPFDPSIVPAHASSTSESPISATFTPKDVTHIPDDVAARIGEKPMQSSGDILRQLKHGLDGGRLKSILSFLAFTAAIFFAAFLINQFIFQSYYVEGTSMTPTLQNNDRLIISKVERTMSEVQGKPYIPERGQIVVLDSSIVGLNGQHEQLIKRVIGLPGDHVHIESGTVIITNSQHPSGYDVTRDLGLTNLQATYVETPIDLTVPTGQVYVMGDNREQGGSYDSRAFGPIEGGKIQGRLWGRILPIDHAQLY